MSYSNRDLECSDVVTVGFAPAAGFTPERPGMTEWGYAWRSLDETMGQPDSHPLADPAAINAYRPPEPGGSERTAHLPAQLEANADRFVKANLGITGFNQATFLRGYEAFLDDLVTAPERAEHVLDLVFGFENAIIDRLCALPVDALQFYDDWGTQNGLMISPAMWRRVFKPRYAEQFARIRRSGKKVWFHSCGHVHAMIADMIEIGADVLELLQPDVMGMERLAGDFGGQVCFCCSVDHQRVALTGTREDIQDCADRLVQNLGSHDGGLIACIEHYGILGMTDETYGWIREAFGSTELGVSRRLPPADHGSAGSAGG
jgi:hypothetical protein